MSLIWFIPSVFTNYDTRFSKYQIEVPVALSSTRAKKTPLNSLRENVKIVFCI